MARASSQSKPPTIRTAKSMSSAVLMPSVHRALIPLYIRAPERRGYIARTGFVSVSFLICRLAVPVLLLRFGHGLAHPLANLFFLRIAQFCPRLRPAQVVASCHKYRCILFNFYVFVFSGKIEKYLMYADALLAELEKPEQK